MTGQHALARGVNLDLPLADESGPLETEVKNRRFRKKDSRMSASSGITTFHVSVGVGAPAVGVCVVAHLPQLIVQRGHVDTPTYH